jgi:hypothetical protein
MLAELMTLADAIEPSTKGVKSWNPRMKDLPSLKAGRKVYIDKMGVPKKVEEIGNDAWENYKYYAPSNQSMFPMFNILSKKDIEFLKDADEEDVKRFLEVDGKKTIAKISHVVDLLKSISEVSEKKISINELNKRINKQDLETFIHDLVWKIAESLTEDVKSDKIQVILELDKPGSLGYINDDATYDILNDAADCLDKQNEGGTFSSVVIPNIGKYFPYSRNDANPCFSRYGMNALKACSVAKGNERKIIHSLEFIFTKENKGKYWDSFVHDSGNSVFVVYADTAGLTDKEKDVVESFTKKNSFKEWIGGDKKLDELERAKKQKEEEQARVQLLGDMKLIVAKKPDIPVYIFSFFVPSNGPAKLLFFNNMTMDSVYERVSEWQAVIDHCTPFNKIISIFELYNIINVCWNRSAGLEGQKKYKDAKLLKFDFVKPVDIFNLIFNDDKKILKKCITVLSKSHWNLLIDIAQRKNVKEDLMNKMSRKNVYDNTCFMVYCLKAAGHDIESNDFYKLGNLIREAEKLQFCFHDAKKNRISLSSYIGADTARLVTVNPMKAIAQMFGKINLYMKWAKSEVGPKSDDELRYAYYGLKKVVGSIDIDKIENKPKSEDILMLGLGYYGYYVGNANLKQS